MRLIDADDIIAIIEEKQKALCPAGKYGRQYVYGDDRIRLDAWDEILDRIENIPTVKVEPVQHGRWIERPYLLGISNFCSRCGGNDGMPHGKFNYCPNCGAKMDLV